jgi:hypothetical protein
VAQFSSRRDESTDRTYFEDGRSQYLEAKVAAQVRSPLRLCNALEEINEPLGGPYRRSGYPWITLVLGSGCLEAGQDIGGTGIRDVPERVETLLSDQPPLPDGTNAAKFARAFAESLIADRLGSGGGSSDPLPQPSHLSKASDRVTTETALLLLCTALLTRLYHLASASQPDALSRAGRDRVVLRKGVAGSAELRTDALEPALKLLADLRANTESAQAWSAEPVEEAHDNQVLLQALEAIDHSLNSVRGAGLKIVDVQLLTELCWYSLTRGTAVYPGWSDLLLHLSTRHSPPLLDRWQPRPAFDDIDSACKLVEQRYRSVTRASWDQLVASDESERERFYSTAALLLREQAKLRAASPKSGVTQPPIASAFVTSFDLELEMALWRSSTEPFVVAVPLNLLQDVDEPQALHLASVCWLACIVRPDHSLSPAEQLDQLCKPAESDWFVLSGQVGYELVYGNYPVVVRLSGSPLMSVPQLWKAGGEWNDLCRELLDQISVPPPKEPADAFNPELRLAHVALLDEYSAMQHAAAEFYIYQSGTDVNERRRSGLPLAIAGTQTSAFARFWMMMGVQVSDSSIRYRFASQLAVPRNMDGRLASAIKNPKRAGMVVNWRTDDTVRDLLGWYNFDVVIDRCESFQEDLQHYLRHLQTPPRKAQARERCDLT